MRLQTLTLVCAVLIFSTLPLQAETTKKIGVFCSSDEKIPKNYKDCAYSLGQALATSGLGLITGGANSGLMSSVVNGYASKGKEVNLHGVMPSLFKSYNVHHAKIPEANLTWTETIYNRLQHFQDNCDAFVVLPGGFGTLHELMDFIVPKQWGLINKKIVLFNFDHFWDYQLLQFKTMVEKNALQQKHLDMITVVTTQEQCIQALTTKTQEKPQDLKERYWEKETPAK